MRTQFVHTRLAALLFLSWKPWILDKQADSQALVRRLWLACGVVVVRVEGVRMATDGNAPSFFHSREIRNEPCFAASAPIKAR